jgi:hypothetical protein
LNAVALGSGELQKTLDRFKSEMDAARDYLVESVRLGHPASPAAQWVIDNAYLIKLNLGEIRKELRDEYRRHRSHLGRLVKLAQQLVDRTGGRVSDDPMVRFLAEAQREEELDSAQLWAFPLFLRIVLIEDLTELAHRLSRVQQLREAAFLWADRIVHSANEGAAAVHQVAQRLRTEAFAQDPTFLTALAEQLQIRKQRFIPWREKVCPLLYPIWFALNMSEKMRQRFRLPMHSERCAPSLESTIEKFSRQSAAPKRNCAMIRRGSIRRVISPHETARDRLWPTSLVKPNASNRKLLERRWGWREPSRKSLPIRFSTTSLEKESARLRDLSPSGLQCGNARCACLVDMAKWCISGPSRF